MRLPVVPLAFPLALSLAAAAGPVLATTLVCNAPGESAGPVARVGDPWGDAPVLQGAGDAHPVQRFVRGQMIIFDAGREVLYFYRGNHAFAYTQVEDGGGIVTLRGTCEEGA